MEGEGSLSQVEGAVQGRAQREGPCFKSCCMMYWGVVGELGLVGTVKDSPESPELAVRGSDREARLCGVTVMFKGLCRGSSRPG